MGFFIGGIALAVFAITGAFTQGQQNPDAGNFFESKAHIQPQERFIVDEHN